METPDLLRMAKYFENGEVLLRMDRPVGHPKANTKLIIWQPITYKRPRSTSTSTVAPKRARTSAGASSSRPPAAAAAAPAAPTSAKMDIMNQHFFDKYWSQGGRDYTDADMYTPEFVEYVQRGLQKQAIPVMQVVHTAVLQRGEQPAALAKTMQYNASGGKIDAGALHVDYTNTNSGIKWDYSKWGRTERGRTERAAVTWHMEGNRVHVVVRTTQPDEKYKGDHYLVRFSINGREGRVDTQIVKRSSVKPQQVPDMLKRLCRLPECFNFTGTVVEFNHKLKEMFPDEYAVVHSNRTQAQRKELGNIVFGSALESLMRLGFVKSAGVNPKRYTVVPLTN